MSFDRTPHSIPDTEVSCTAGTAAAAAAAEVAMSQLVQALARSVARELQAPKASRSRGTMPLFSLGDVGWWIPLIALVMMVMMFYRYVLSW